MIALRLVCRPIPSANRHADSSDCRQRSQKNAALCGHDDRRRRNVPITATTVFSLRKPMSRWISAPQNIRTDNDEMEIMSLQKANGKVGSRAKREEQSEQLHTWQQSKRTVVEYSWCRGHHRNDAVEIARNFLVEILHMRFRLIEKTENDLNPSARVTALAVWSDMQLELMITVHANDNVTETAS